MLNGLPQSNKEREVWDMLNNIKALHDELVSNEALVVIKNDKVSWPVFKSKITFNRNEEMSQFNAITKYMNNRGMVGDESDVIIVGRVGVRAYFERYYNKVKGQV